jgi:hypothetical protein
MGCTNSNSSVAVAVVTDADKIDAKAKEKDLITWQTDYIKVAEDYFKEYEKTVP